VNFLFDSSFFVVALFGDVFQCAGRDDPKHKCFYWVHTLGLKKKVPLLSRLCLCVVCLDVVCWWFCVFFLQNSVSPVKKEKEEKKDDKDDDKDDGDEKGKGERRSKRVRRATGKFSE
jgi:hypothetical protein